MYNDFKIRKKRNQDLYCIYFPDGSLHSTHPTRRLAKQSIKGGSIFSDIDKVNAIITGSRKDGLPPSSREVLKKYGNIPVVKCDLYRYPISSTFHKAIILLAKGEKLKYDKYMHLGILFTLSDGKVINVEKDYNVIISLNKKLPPQTEIKDVPLYHHHLTMNEIITNTRNKMGLTKFEKYEALGRNCQNLVLNILRANHIGNKSDEEFVIQDLSDLIKIIDRYPYLKQIINASTDTARAVDILLHGAGRIKYQAEHDCY